MDSPYSKTFFVNQYAHINNIKQKEQNQDQPNPSDENVGWYIDSNPTPCTQDQEPQQTPHSNRQGEDRFNSYYVYTKQKRNIQDQQQDTDPERPFSWYLDSYMSTSNLNEESQRPSKRSKGERQQRKEKYYNSSHCDNLGHDEKDSNKHYPSSSSFTPWYQGQATLNPTSSSSVVPNQSIALYHDEKHDPRRQQYVHQQQQQERKPETQSQVVSDPKVQYTQVKSQTNIGLQQLGHNVPQLLDTDWKGESSWLGINDDENLDVHLDEDHTGKKQKLTKLDNLDDDTSSVESYGTAPSEPIEENYGSEEGEIESIGSSEEGEIKSIGSSEEGRDENEFMSALPEMDDVYSTTQVQHCPYFMEMIEKYGPSPGSINVRGPIEHDEVKIPSEATKFLKDDVQRNWAIRMIERFSSAKVQIYRPHEIEAYSMKSEGTFKQLFYAIKGIDAILMDNVNSRRYCVFVRVDGPQLKQQADAISNILSSLGLGDIHISRHEDLHITVAKVTIKRNAHPQCLLSTVRKVMQEYNGDYSLGHYNRMHNFSKSNLGISTKEGKNHPIKIIRNMIQDELAGADYVKQIGGAGRDVHLTLYKREKAARYRKGKSRKLAEPTDEVPYPPLERKHLDDQLEAMNVDFDFGPLYIKSIEISRVAITVSSVVKYIRDYEYKL
ncbi:hypothetical protein BDA99DRAFT_565720 [Phascolomyces articulosus]|uniref:Uncharacterized protein n=1 Tax=Phascolomyces articulosus TaxID=60185 RepID=A0AAD5JXS6_9FUNG|nr:hypothetical protein BDA99DRAFT_565720 [Phascolomyces articulosus]